MGAGAAAGASVLRVSPLQSFSWQQTRRRRDPTRPMPPQGAPLFPVSRDSWRVWPRPRLRSCSPAWATTLRPMTTGGVRGDVPEAPHWWTWRPSPQAAEVDVDPSVEDDDRAGDPVQLQHCHAPRPAASEASAAPCLFFLHGHGAKEMDSDDARAALEGERATRRRREGRGIRADRPRHVGPGRRVVDLGLLRRAKAAPGEGRVQSLRLRVPSCFTALASS